MDVGPWQLTLARPTFPEQEGCRVGGFGDEAGWLMDRRRMAGGQEEAGWWSEVRLGGGLKEGVG